MIPPFTNTQAEAALDQDETALWLATLDGHEVTEMEQLHAVNQRDYRIKADYLTEYLTGREVRDGGL